MLKLEKSKPLKIGVFVFLIVFLSTFVMASYEVDNSIDFKIEANSSPCYITVDYPNTTSLVDNGTMTFQTGFGNYSFTPTELGYYNYYGECGGDSFSGSFFVTYNGEDYESHQWILPLILVLSGILFMSFSFVFSNNQWMVKAFLQFIALCFSIISVNSAMILSSSSDSLRTMGTSGLVLGIVVFSVMFIYIFVLNFIEIIKALKEKRGVRFKF